MTDWIFFPDPAEVFADGSGRYFVPLATVDMGRLLPGTGGPVHFLRPRLIDGEDTARRIDPCDYPSGWYPFHRDRTGQYHTAVALGGDPDPEPHDPFETRHQGNACDRFIRGEIGADDLLRHSDLGGTWPDANWNEGRSATDLVGRPLHFLGELDASNFGRSGDAGSVLLYDPGPAVILQVFHWT